MPPTEIDTINKFLVAGTANHNSVFLRPVPQQLSEQDALLLAAYLVSLVGDHAQWEATLAAVQGA